MHFTASAVVLAFASMVLAADPTPDFDAISTPTSGSTINAGSTFEVDWTTVDKYSGVTVSLALIGGADQPHLQTISTIATGVKNSDMKYQWAVDPSLGTLALYGLVFTNEQNTTIFQYSQPFHIAASASTGNSSTTTVTTSVGTKTVSLSEAPTTTSAPASNLTTTSAGPGKTTITTRVGASTTSSSPTAASTGAGAHATAGSMLGLAGFALAALAL